MAGSTAQVDTDPDAAPTEQRGRAAASPASRVGEAERAVVRSLARCFVLDLAPEAIAAELGPVCARLASWDAVAWLCERHRVSTLAYELLRLAPVRAACGVPEATIARLRGRYTATFVQVTTELPAYHRGLAELAGAGVPVLAVKGPVLGSWLYGDPVRREHEDLDVIVPEVAAARCRAVLTDLGYHHLAVGSPLGRLSSRESLSTDTFASPSPGPTLDVSYDPLRLFWKPGCGASEWFAGWWARRRPVAVGGRTVETLGLEDDLMYLMRHLQFHDFFRTNWFVDVLLLLRRHGDELDWDGIGRRARAHGIHGGLFRAMELIESAYRIPVPPEARTALLPSRALQALHRRVWPDSLANQADASRLGGSPLVPRFVSLRGANPVAALALLAAQPNRGQNFGYLARRYVPTRAWLRSTYRESTGPQASYPALMLRHWRHLRAIRRGVIAEHRAKSPRWVAEPSRAEAPRRPGS